MRVLLFSVMALAIGSGCAQQSAGPRRLAEVQAWRKAYEPIKAEQRKAYRAEKGFGPARWGMTLEELTAALADRGRDAFVAEPRGEQHEVFSTAYVGGEACPVRYLLVNGQLTGAELDFPRGESIRADFDFVHGALTGKYGLPSASTDSQAEALSDLSTQQSLQGIALTLNAVAELASTASHGRHSYRGPDASDALLASNLFEARRQEILNQPFSLSSSWRNEESALELLGSSHTGLLRIHYWSRMLGKPDFTSSLKNLDPAELAKDL